MVFFSLHSRRIQYVFEYTMNNENSDGYKIDHSYAASNTAYLLPDIKMNHKKDS